MAFYAHRDPFAFGRYDIVVIGAGVAGLTFALRLPRRLRVALVTKGVLGESNTRYAQGGLAAAVGADDRPDLHLADTLAVGAGLCDVGAVTELVEGAPPAVAWLADLGTKFDLGADGAPALGREAAHSRRRVLHAGGDATGAEVERTLVRRVSAAPNVEVFPGAFALDLVPADDRCVGVVVQLGPNEPPVQLSAPVTVLAAGGAGQLWATSSNPAGATADGLAMAVRAGVPIADVEFVQFHPTVLALAGSQPFLVSEAVRGEGAYLRNAAGDRFMTDLHPLAELAPRDVVARGIQRQMALEDTGSVWLDLRHLDAGAMRSRFPTITAELARQRLDLATDLIPVAPAAHYMIGGVAASPSGHTGLPGLLALGEAACTGVHGANRLASNSLLEGLVFGIASADRVASDALPNVENLTRVRASRATARPNLPSDRIAELRGDLQRAMSRHCAVVRDAEGMLDAQRVILATAERLGLVSADGPIARDAWELRNMVDAASVVVAAALRRHESRGAHERRDFPLLDPALDGRHSIRLRENWRFGALAEAWTDSDETVSEQTVPHLAQVQN